MKYPNYTDLGIVSSKKPFNTHLWWEHTTYGLILVDSADQTKLFISTDKGDNWVEIDLSDNTNSYKIQSGWLEGNDLWLVMCDNDGTADDFEVCFIELDDSNDCNPIGVSAGADANSVYAYDIWVYDGNTYALTKRDVGGAGWVRVIVWDVDTNPFVLKDKVIDGSVSGDYVHNSFGALVGDNFYFFGYIASSSSLVEYVYDHSATDLIQNNFVANHSLPDRNQQGVAYDGSDLLYFTGNKDADGKDYLIAYSITGDSFTVLGEYNIALMLNRNTALGILEKAFHITRFEVYQLHPTAPYQLYLIAIPDTGEVIIGITDNFLITTTGKMFELEDLIGKITSLHIIHEIMTGPIGNITLDKNSLTLEENMLVKIFHNYTTEGATSEQVIFEGLVVLPSNDPYQTIALTNPGTKELGQIKPRGTFSGKSDEIITSLLSTYTNYITKGTFTAGTEMGDVDFGGDKTLETILDGLAYFEGFIWYLTPTGVLYYNNGTIDSTKNFTGASNIRAVISNFLHDEYNKIKVRGAYVDGVQVESEWQEDLESQQRIGIVEKIFTIAFLKTIALCNTAANNILTRLTTPPQKIEFVNFDTTIGLIQPGETITFEYASGITISSDQFLISGAEIDIVGDINYIGVDDIV